MNSAKSEKVTRVLNAVAAGQTEQTSSAIDMAGFEGCKIYAAFGAITTGSVVTVKLQQSSDDGSADAYSDLEGTSSAVADDRDNDLVVIDINRPTKRYLKVVIGRTTQNAVIDGVLAVQYGPRVMPTTDDSTTVVSRETHVSPAEGTA